MNPPSMPGDLPPAPTPSPESLGVNRGRGRGRGNYTASYRGIFSGRGIPSTRRSPSTRGPSARGPSTRGAPTTPHNPTPASILWAHELRRETRHLVAELDQTKSSLASAVTTTTALQQSVSDLRKLVQELQEGNRLLSGKLHVVEELYADRCDGFNESVDLLTEIVEPLAGRFNVLESRADAVERELADDVKGLVLDDLRATLREEFAEWRDGQESEGYSGDSEGFEGPESSDIMSNIEQDFVPDSMPVDKGISYLQRKRPRQESSSARSDSSTQADDSQADDSQDDESYETHSDKPCKRMYYYLPMDRAIAMEQQGRALYQYLLVGEDVHAQVPSDQKNGNVLVDFVSGIEDLEAKAVVEEQLDRVGWTWDAMKRVLWPIACEQEADRICEERMEQQTMRNRAESARNAGANVEHAKPKKKRRCIPIVPPDEEDMEFISEI